MKQLNKTIKIAAPKETVWQVLLQDETYRKWAAAFHAESLFEGNWEPGTTMYFKTPENSGMISKVLEHVPNQKVMIEHIGMLDKGTELFDGTGFDEWLGAKEAYYVSQQGDIITLTVTCDISEEYFDWLNNAWDAALALVKQLAEE